jgi:hypothetical protein
MATDTNKTASQMLFHELAANNGAKPDIVDRLLVKHPFRDLTGEEIKEAAHLIVDLRKMIDKMNDMIRQLHTDVEKLGYAYDYAMNERDEARRMYCTAVGGCSITPAKIANNHGWDCFMHFPHADGKGGSNNEGN